MIEAGRRSKCRSIAARIRSSGTCPVPKVSMETESGWAIPIP